MEEVLIILKPDLGQKAYQVHIIQYGALTIIMAIDDCSVSFMTLKMKVEFEEGADPARVMKDVKRACKKVEDDCEIFGV